MLERGDVAIVGVNTSNSDGSCPGANSSDLISIVFFKDLQPGTSFIISDNGYGRTGENTWGNTEGTIRCTYNGTTPLIKGTIIRISTIENNWTAMPSDWLFESLTGQGIHKFALSNSGDQIYIMTDGIWNNGTSSENDASFEGNVLYAFSNNGWCSTNCNNSNKSKLHPDIAECNSMSINSESNKKYNLYKGASTPATHLTWLNRIKNPNNWDDYSSCSSYNSNDTLDFIEIIEDVSLSVTPQILCEPGEVSLTFDISDASQAYDIVYTDGSQSYSLNNITGSHVEDIDITEMTTFSLVSANLTNDPDSCPVYSDLTMQSVTVEVLSPTLITFDNDTICLGETYEFPDTQGISGTWSPASIDTTTLGTQTYTFTPNDACYSKASFDLTVLPVPDREYIIVLSNSEHNQGDQPFQLRQSYEMCGDNLFDLPLAELQALLAHFDLVLTSPTEEEIDLTDEYTDLNGILRLIAQMQGFVEEGTWQVQVFHEDDNPALPYSGSTCSWTGSLELIIHSSPDAGIISGDTEVCVGQSINLSSTVSGGTWSSDNVALATVDSNTGEVTGIAEGIVNIKYSVSSENSCSDGVVSYEINVKPIPQTSPIEILP